MRKYLIAIVLAAVGIFGLTAGPSIANSLIGSSDIENGAVRGIDVADGENGVKSVDVTNETLRLADLRPAVQGKLNTDIGVRDLESDGPYPGATDLEDFPGNGDNSDALVPNDGTQHTVWVQCAADKTALGGGFTLAADAGATAAAAVHVTESVPTQVENGQVVYDPIEGDAAGSLVPNGWAVTAINTGAADVIVRPWVICANLG